MFFWTINCFGSKHLWKWHYVTADVCCARNCKYF